MQRIKRAVAILAIASLLALCVPSRATADFYNPPNTPPGGDLDPFWLVRVGALLLLPLPFLDGEPTPTAPAPAGATKRVVVQTESGSQEQTIQVPPGGSITLTIVQPGNGSQSQISQTISQADTGSTSSFSGTMEGSGFAANPGSSSFGSDSIAASQGATALGAFNRVPVSLQIGALQLGTLVFGSDASPMRSAFSSVALDVTLTVPDFGLSFPVFSGSASLGQTAQGSSFAASGDFATIFTVGPGILPNGGLGTIANANDLALTRTISMPMELPAGTRGLFNLNLSGVGSASIVPEPPAVVLLGIGALGLLPLVGRVRKRLCSQDPR